MNTEEFQKILAGSSSPGGDSATPSVAATNGDEEEAADVGAKVVSSTVPSEETYGVRYPERIVPSTVPAKYKIEYYPGSEDEGMPKEPRWYRIDGVEVPSVTTITDVLKKDALPWWGMKVGIAGTVSVIREGAYMGHLDDGEWDLEANNDLIELLKERGLTVNQVRDKAADRGTSVHRGLESWAVTGQLPDEDDFPEEQRGYVKAIRTFFADCKGELEPIHSELMVGSKEHGFAGRFDLMAHSPGLELKTGPRTTRKVPPGVGIWDLKTANKIRPAYDSHRLQVAGYRLGCEEGGYGRSEYEAILQVTPEGRYDVKISDKRPDQFVAILGAWRANR